MINRIENEMFLRELLSPGSKRTILYLHGMGESGLCFERIMNDKQLAGWSHIALDLSGYGKTPWPDSPLGIEEHAILIADWLYDKRIDQVVLLGHSLSGVIGSMICEKSVGLIEAFINVEGNISLDDCMISGRVACTSLDDFIAFGFDNLCENIYKQGASDKTMRGYYASLRMCDPRCFYLNSHELVEFSRSERLASRLAALPVPVLYIFGTPRGTGRHSQNLLNDAKVPTKAIEDAGHWVFIDQHAAFVGAMITFLKSLPGGDRDISDN